MAAEAEPADSTPATSEDIAVADTSVPVSTTSGASVAPSYSWPDDLTEVVGFWASLQMSAFEIYRFGTLEELADSATVVVVGTPVGPGPSAVIGGDPDNDEATSVFSLIVEVKDVVRSRGELLGIHTPTVGDQIAVIVDRNPSRGVSSAPVVMFLQAVGDNRYYYQIPPKEVAAEHRDYYIEQLEAWEAFRVGKYRFINSQSLLAGDGHTTMSPMMSASADPLASELSGTPISDIIEEIRSMPPPR